jgi:hypothetical protein
MRPPCFLTYEALVVERLYLESERRGEAPTPRMTNALERYFSTPGIPRMIFALLVDQKHPLFKQALRLCLEDETVTGDVLTPFLETFATFIDRNIDLKSLNASKKRRQFIADVLAKAKRIEFPPK